MDININWFSFILGGLLFLVSFLLIMGWFVPDRASVRAMTWIAKRRNISKVSLFVGTAMIVVFLVMIVIAVIKILHLVQMAPWVWWVVLIGLGLSLISLTMLIITRRRSN